MSDRNPHIAGKYAVIVALIGLMGTFGGILLTHYLNAQKENVGEVENVEPKNEKDQTLKTELLIPKNDNRNASCGESKRRVPSIIVSKCRTPKILSVGDCYIVRLNREEDRIMFRTRPLTSLEIDAVNKEYGSIAKETEIANGLYYGQQVTYLGSSGSYYKVKAYIKEEGKVRIGYLAKTLGGVQTLVIDDYEWPR